MILICIHLITSELDCLFICFWANSISFSVNYLFMSFTSFPFSHFKYSSCSLRDTIYILFFIYPLCALNFPLNVSPLRPFFSRCNQGISSLYLVYGLLPQFPNDPPYSCFFFVISAVWSVSLCIFP